MKINSLLLIPTKNDIKDVYHRKMELNIQHGGVNKLQKVFTESGVNLGNQITNTEIASAVPGLASFSTVPDRKVDIVHGWYTQRLRFILVTEAEFGNSVMVSYIQGYTEYYDPSYKGTISDTMYFYINSITNVIKMISPVTNEIVVRPHNSYNVISDEVGGKSYQEILSPDTDFNLVRPVDIVNGIKSIEEEHVPGTKSQNVFAGTIESDNIASRKSNADPVNFITKTINNVVLGKSNVQLSSNSEYTDALKSASITLAEPIISDVALLAYLKKINGGVIPTKFTLNELNVLTQNNMSKITTLIDNSLEAYNVNPEQKTLMEITDVESLNKNNRESALINKIIHTINGYMADALLSELTLVAHNTNGSYEANIIAYDSMIDGIGVYGVSYANSVLSSVKTVLLPDITHNGLIVVDFIITSSIKGTTTIDISFNLGPRMVYRLPTFADSLYTPVVADTAGRTEMTNDLSTVLDLTFGNQAEDLAIMM